MPAILIELGFLSNRSEHGQLTSSKRQQQIAEAVALAVKKFDQQTHPQ
jgi:N-acetylmuramoyl-L-alanine amidase